MADLPLTLALERYDRHIPFFDGSVAPAGVALTALDVGQNYGGRHGADRKHRILAGEFDVGELSLGSYVMLRDRGEPFTAIPVFPRRLFSASRWYVNAAAGIRTPADLVGRRVGLSSYQTTLSVLAKGDLEREYGVPWREIIWVAATEEPMPFDLPAGARLERVPPGARLDELLLDGTLQAVAHPQPPPAIQGSDPRVRRLFADAPAEERAYYQRNGYWPAMHVVAFKETILREHPWVAEAFMAAFAHAREIAYRYYDDPNWSRLAWGRHYFEDELALFGGDPWRDGLAANRPYLACFLAYAHDQGLIGPRLTPEDLFVESTRQT